MSDQKKPVRRNKIIFHLEHRHKQRRTPETDTLERMSVSVNNNTKTSETPLSGPPADENTVVVQIGEREGQQQTPVCSPDEAQQYLTELFQAHTDRAMHIKESRRLNTVMTKCKKPLTQFMSAYGRDRIGIEEEGKYLKSCSKERNRGFKIGDLLHMIERDLGQAKREQYERELATLGKTKVRTQYSQITFMGMRKRGEANPGAMPPRKRTRKN